MCLIHFKGYDRSSPTIWYEKWDCCTLTTRLEPEATPNTVPPQEVRDPHLKISLVCGLLPYHVSYLAIMSSVKTPYVALVSAYNERSGGKVKEMNVWSFVNWIWVSFMFCSVRMFETAESSDHSLEQFLWIMMSPLWAPANRKMAFV